MQLPPKSINDVLLHQKEKKNMEQKDLLFLRKAGSTAELKSVHSFLHHFILIKFIFLYIYGYFYLWNGCVQLSLL